MSGEAFIIVINICFQTIHDEFQALQLAYTQLEKRQRDLDEANMLLRHRITEILEKPIKDSDEQVRMHQKLVLFQRLVFV